MLGSAAVISLIKNGQARLRRLPGAPENFPLFRRFLAFKIALPFLLDHGLYAWPDFTVTSVLALVALALSSTRRWFRWGVLPLFGLSAYECWATWPFTLNHIALETIVLALLLLEPETPPAEARLPLGRKIQWVMLSVWFYSGVQKLAHGCFASGELLAMEMMARDSHMGRNLELLFRALQPILGGDLPTLFCCRVGELTLPFGWRVLLAAMGVATILSEIGLPLAVFFAWRARLAVIALFLFQFSVAVMSSEWDFAFTAFAILFLFTSNWVARIAYPLLAVGYLLVSPWA